MSATNWIADLETIIRHLNTVKKSQVKTKGEQKKKEIKEMEATTKKCEIKVLTFRKNKIKVITERGGEEKDCWWNLKDLCKSLRIDLMKEGKGKSLIPSIKKTLKVKENEIREENQETSQGKIIINLAGLEKFIDYCEGEMGPTTNFCQWMIERAFPSIWENIEEGETDKLNTASTNSKQDSRTGRITA